MTGQTSASSRDRSGQAIRMLIPGLLRSYTAGADRVDLGVASNSKHGAPMLADALVALDARFPGFRFRIIDEQGNIRPHIKLFVNGELARDLTVILPPSAEVMIVGALSGG